jgi:hypothetical protein
MRSLSWSVVVALALGMLGCTKPNPRDCSDGTCTDPAFPFCDQAGTFGRPQTCIAVTCTAGDFAACQGTQALTCNANGNDYEVSQCEHGCDADARGCVACLDNTQCANPNPTCDSTTHTCRACQVDADCTSEVCDDRSGACIDAASIIYAAADGSAAGDCGSQATPCTFDRAFTLIDSTHHTVKVRPGTYDTTRAVSYTTNAPDELFFDGAGATVNNGASAPLFEVLGSGRLFIKGFTFQFKAGAAGENSSISCGTFDVPAVTNLDAEDIHFTGDGSGLIHIFSCVASLRRIHFVMKGIGLTVVRGGVVTIDQSMFEAPSTSSTSSNVGISTIDPTTTPHAQIHVINSVFANLNEDMFLTQGTIDVQFSTFVNIVDPIDCTNDTKNAQRTYANSVFVRTDKQQVAVDSPCIFHDDIMFPQFVVPTHSDNLLFNVDPMLKDIANGDYHLLPGSHAIDAADPSSTEMIDYDGAKRPDGVLRDLGAFEFHAP